MNNLVKNESMTSDDIKKRLGENLKRIRKEQNLTQFQLADLQTKIEAATTRKLVIVGCGDGGCKIATEISNHCGDDVCVVAYNTTTRTMEEMKASYKVLPKGLDGHGKQRGDSKEAFKNPAHAIHTVLLNHVKEAIRSLGDVGYILVTSTTDGGTGSGVSPMVAKLLADETDIPTILLGVYPSADEDATAQFNAVQWQQEVEKIQVPHILLDNNTVGNNDAGHQIINTYAARIASLIAGREFGNTTISIIDDRNLSMLLNRIGDRMVIAVEDVRPTSQQSLDDCVADLIDRCHQPAPGGVRGIGVFVKGPMELLNRMDTSLPGIQAKYGSAVLKFAHLEESSETRIAVILSGCFEATDRIAMMRAKWDDVMAGQRRHESTVNDVISGMTNPLDGTARRSSVNALDL